MQTIGSQSGRMAQVQRRVSGMALPQRLCSAPRAVVGANRRRQTLVVSASTLTPRMPNSNEDQELNGTFNAAMSTPMTTIMAKGGGGGMGSGSSLGATMERSKMNFVMPTPVIQGPKLDDGGDGGDIGKINRNGGGGGDDGGDDDDYFGEGEDGDGDGEGEARDGFFRVAIPESYDKLSIGAVLAEWMKTVAELPAILRQAVTMGLFSSAQLVRFFSMDVRPNVTRAVSRRLPPSVAREFVGRLMADPGFVQKLILESSFAAVASMVYEYRLRGDKLKGEVDLALINTLGMAAATGATVWLLAPCRSFGSIQKFPWQQMIGGLPNCVFDASGPLRTFTTQARAAGFCAKMAELSAVGALTGTATALLSTAAVAIRQRSNPEWQPSTPVPSIGRSSAGLAAFFAINANVRYQLIGGLDQFLFSRTNFLWTYVALSGAARLASNQVGELSRPWWQGLPSPSTLAKAEAAYVPVPRKVKKKVSKRVPRNRQQPQALDQEQLEAAAPAMMAAAVVALDDAQLQLPTDSLQPSVAYAYSQSDSQQQVPTGDNQAPAVSYSSEAASAMPMEPIQQFDSVEVQQLQRRDTATESDGGSAMMERGELAAMPAYARQ